MRDPRRIPIILALLRQRWEENPDQRLGQLIEGVLMDGFGATPSHFNNHCISQIEDDVVEKALGGEPGPMWAEPNGMKDFLKHMKQKDRRQDE